MVDSKMTLNRVHVENDNKFLTKLYLTRILKSLNHILFIAKISGLFFFSMDKSTHKLNISDKKRTVIYSAAYFSAYSASIMLAFRAYERSEADASFYSLVRRGINVVFTFSTLLQVLMGLMVKRKVAQWFNSLASVDLALGKIGLEVDYAKLRRPFLFLLVLEFAIFLCKIIVYVLAFWKPWVMVLGTACYHFTKGIFKMFLIFLIAYLYQRFKLINTTMDAIGTVANNPRDTPVRLDLMCRIHCRLRNLVEKLNDIASLQFLYSFGVSLGSMLFFSYYLYYQFRTGYSSFTVVIFGMTALIDELMDCFMITKICRMTTNAANNTPKHLHELRYRIEKDTEQWDDCIKVNSVQFLGQKVSFTAQGYFDINLSMLGSMIGTVLTYLVLFIQYDQSYQNITDNGTTYT